ncbi:hypothetical protein Ddye_023788 [Dipteronia dyeriana]|uniref:HAT C-terminal dimerisation domain-containing protein n=1 Tax=Dipteronia dyeriana TaxID=168575 RepID=A0AAD9TUI8_9ROSI|nr:hypothetical protein Ddye_023788 [Dipteronia dyeriana]
MSCPHTAETLCEALYDYLMDWNIDRKLSSITVDNCSTNKQMITSLLEKLNSSDLILNGTLFHMRCYAHILNLIVKDGLDVIGEGNERIRSSVLYWVAKPKRIEKFEDTAHQLNIPYSKRLFLFEWLTNENESIRKLYLDLVKEYELKFKSSDENSIHCNSSLASQLVTPDNSNKQAERLLSYDLFVSSDGPTHVKSEYDAYLGENVLPRAKDFDILVWWRANASKYPFLAQIARDFLAIPVSSVASESAFSTCGRIVSVHRSRFHPDTLEVLMCAQNWLWSERRAFLKVIDDIKKTCTDPHEYLTRIPLENWAVRAFDNMNNVVEAFNVWMKKYCALSMLTMMERVRRKFMKQIQDRHENALELGVKHTTYIPDENLWSDGEFEIVLPPVKRRRDGKLRLSRRRRSNEPRDRLCIFYKESGSERAIWIMKEYGMKDSLN